MFDSSQSSLDRTLQIFLFYSDFCDLGEWEEALCCKPSSIV